MAFAVEFLRRPDRPTAIVCYFAIFTAALLRAATMLGLRVPQDISIVTFAPEAYRENGVMVSAMLEPHYLMGQESVRALCNKISDPKSALPAKPLEFLWNDLDTCAAPRS
jgi:LacI family transcriptional regulator